MEIFSIVMLYTSEIILLLSQVAVLSILLNRNPSKVKLIIAVAITFVLSFFSGLLISSNMPLVQWISLLINNFSGCIISMIIFKTFSFRNMLILINIQFIGLLINSCIYCFVPSDIIGRTTSSHSFFVLLVRIILLLIIWRIKTHLPNSKIQKIALTVPLHIYILLLISLLIENGLIELLNYNTSKTEMKLQITRIFLVLLVICITTTIVSLIINVIYKNHYGTISELLEKQVNIQLDHYTKMEKMNSEIRKFKHDYNNHICCISGLLRAQKYDEIRDYIETISGQMPSGEFMFRTGNYIADAILSDKQEQAASNSITIEFDGHIPPDINNTDLCIILSNAIDNSIEACREVAGNKIISVYGNFQQGYTILIIKNPTVNTISDKTLPETTKNDKLNHGFGLSNIENVVAKYNGKMQTSCDDGTFTLSIALENIDAKITVDV